MTAERRPLRIMVLGVRGVSNVQGGIETHAAQLYPRLAALGCSIEVLVRTPFTPRGQQDFGDIRLTRLWSSTRPGFEAMFHSILGACYAVFARPDILHIHAVGPAFVTPIARLAGLKVVITHHGPDYEREKWGRLARAVLRAGERAGARWANQIIAVSKVIARQLLSRYDREAVLIPNGVDLPKLEPGDDQLRSLHLERGKYYLMVGRMVREKRQLDLIKAFTRAATAGWKLVLVGGLQRNEYSRSVIAAARDAGVVLAGFVNGIPLCQLYAHAGGFVLPSSHEGLPIALLEALSYGLPVLASDIEPNLEVGLDASRYFKLGDVDQLAEGMTRMAATPHDAQVRSEIIQWTLQRYNWDDIARQTLVVYEQVCGPR